MKAILFDLDGTLLDVDMDVFLHNYFKTLAAHCTPFMEPDEFVPHLLSATRAMMSNQNPKLSNQEAFWEHFCLGLDVDKEELMPHITDFYNRVFPTLKEHTRQYDVAPAVIAAAQRLRCPLVLATNPVFPLAAIRHRLHWAGLKEDMFDLITSYETMHYCKPDPNYYLEVCQILGVKPQDCLMIGNDADHDIRAAKAVGMKTFYVTNLVVNPTGADPQADYSGTVEELPQFLETLKTECKQEGAK